MIGSAELETIGPLVWPTSEIQASENGVERHRKKTSEKLMHTSY